jgi:hypothetical protein
VTCGLVAEADFYAVDAVDAGVAGGGAAEDFDFGSGEEAEVGEVVAHFFGQVDGFDDALAANLCVAEGCCVHIRPNQSFIDYTTGWVGFAKE